MKRIIVLLLILSAFSGWAADRPVKIWGYASWYELSPKDWTRSPDMVKTFNDWSQKQFGFQWQYEGNIPKGSTWTQAFTAYTAANGLPDVILGSGDWSAEMTNAFLQLTRDNKLADLSKYFNDPKGYPVLSDTDKGYLRAYQVNGKMYAIPSYWHMKSTDPYAGGPNWITRYS